MLIDTHCHLDDPVLFGRIRDVVENARQAGIDGFVIPGVGPQGWSKIAALADDKGRVYPAFGLHPMLADHYHGSVLAELARFAETAVAIGEIGLDYMLPDMPRELQMTAFRDQLRLAIQMGLPVLIHCRKAFSDLLLIMGEEHAERVGGIMHAFSGSAEVAGDCIRLGFAISVAGPVTYRNAVRPVELVRKIPLEHLVLETDSPDMAPEPFRGSANEPAFLLETAKKVAEIKGVTLEEVAAITTRNAKRVLHL